MPNSVRYYDSTMSGAPSLSNTAGALIGVLDGCLVDGFVSGSVTVNSLVVASNVATATVSAGHQFAMVGNTGPVIRIAGASPAGLDGDWRVTVTSSTVFTFATSGIGDQTATGTISAKRAPAGFSKAFSGTNKAAYRSDDVMGTRLYCLIDDTTTTYARIRGYEGMSGIDTDLVGPFPTDAQLSGGGHVYKASGSSRPWALYSDGRMIYFFCDTANNGSWLGGFTFGDINSYVASDAFGCVLIVSPGEVSPYRLYHLGSATGSCMARTYTQLGGSILSARYSHAKTTDLGAGGQLYPAIADNSLHLWPVECWENTAFARGLMTGLWNPIHAGNTPNGLVVDDIPNLPGRTVKIHTTGSASYQCAIDLTGPWR